MLEVGNGGMTKDEYVVHFSIWAISKVFFLLSDICSRCVKYEFRISVRLQIVNTVRLYCCRLPFLSVVMWGIWQKRLWRSLQMKRLSLSTKVVTSYNLWLKNVSFDYRTLNFCWLTITDPLGVQAKKVRMEGDLEVRLKVTAVFFNWSTSCCALVIVL